MTKSIYAEFRDSFSENKPVQQKKTVKFSVVLPLAIISIIAVLLIL